MSITRCLSIVLLVFPAVAAHAEIYRCIGKNAMTVYQNFPCATDSLGSLPTPSSGAKSWPARDAGTHAEPQSVAVENPAAHAPSRPSPAVPRVGMTRKQVRAIWGKPVDFYNEEPAKGDIEIWTFANSRSIRFDHKGRVTAIDW